MAGSKSDYLETALLNHVLRATALASPSTVYVGLYTTAPTDAGGGVEVSGNGYARKAIAFSAPAGGSTSNSSTVTFPAAVPAGWGTVVAFGVFDSLSSGNLLYWATLTDSRTVAIGEQPYFPAASLVISDD